MDGGVFRGDVYGNVFMTNDAVFYGNIHGTLVQASGATMRGNVYGRIIHIGRLHGGIRIE
jgi:hypothetical protein